MLVVECLDKVSETRSRSSSSRVLITLQVASSDTFRTSLDSQTRSRVLSTTSTLTCRIQYLPLSCRADPKTITLPNEPYTCGTRTNVYRGTQNGRSAGVKVLRTSNQEDLAKLKKVGTKRTM